MADHGHLLMASPNMLPPDVEEELRLRFSMPVRTVLCTPSGSECGRGEVLPARRHGPGRGAEKGRQAGEGGEESGGRRREPSTPAGPLSAEERAEVQDPS